MKSKKIVSIFNVAFRQIINSGFNVLLPFIVIHFSSKQVWGEFVSILLFILFAAACANFGSREFLLRQFSRQPGNFRRYFTLNFYARLPILLFLMVVAFFIFPLEPAFFIGISLLGIYISQSFEAIIIFEKKFALSAILESILGILFFLTVLSLRLEISPALIMKIFAGMQLLKAIVFVYFFFDAFEKKGFVLDFPLLKESLPFFLLMFMGFLASKNDVYLVGIFLNKAELAEYQVINSLCLFAMGTSGFFYTPFTKNIYRNDEAVIRKMKNILAFLGLIVAVVAVAVIYFVTDYYLKALVPGYFYTVTFIYIFPSFVYGIEIVKLYRYHMEMKVARYIFLGIIVSMILTTGFLYFGLGITGALMGSAAAQLAVLCLFFQPIQEQRRA